ncbi:predicted protein [Plenodomus lingam JN3]|uniref:Predicted protein n=1 Tax=Leptosphaeria maculans (strain JN3 / isolate v23.1.3 / race Av1-4-5-6-7-8) TaxID=985895 RepID=E5AEU6_LEPMJ|nr:predicted protein [Plenodomus lingam JN3]CBY01735.1 predicted protein [Plenodomus lingam JN3]
MPSFSSYTIAISREVQRYERGGGKTAVNEWVRLGNGGWGSDWIMCP